MIAALKQQVRGANLELVERGLVFDTFGNASGIDRDLGLVVIKPSGVPYGELSRTTWRSSRSSRANTWRA